jgi:hypothetical protein
VIDDLHELGFESESLQYNAKYKKCIKKHYTPSSIFYIAFTVDIVSQEIETKPMKTFHKIQKA